MGIGSTNIELQPGSRGANTYLPGETISGMVELVIKSGVRSHKLSKAYVKLRGRADTDWSTGSGDNKRSYWEIVWLVRLETPLLDIREGEVKSLTPGRHVLPFSFILPENLPHSQKHYEGKVVYSIKARAKSAKWWSWDGKAQLDFTVSPFRDLSKEPRLGEPVTIDREAKSSWFRSDPGPFRATLQRQGFIAGDSIDIRVDGDDQVLQALVDKGETVRLKKRIIFRAGRDDTESKEVIETVKPESVSALRHARLTVPVGEVTMDTDVCPIINISYYVKVYDLSLPVTLGTVPVMPGKYGGFFEPH